MGMNLAERALPLGWSEEEVKGQYRLLAPSSLYPRGARLFCVRGRLRRRRLAICRKGPVTVGLVRNENQHYARQRSLFEDPLARRLGFKNFAVVADLDREGKLSVHLVFATGINESGRVLHCEDHRTLHECWLLSQTDQPADAGNLPPIVEVEPEIFENFEIEDDQEDFGT
jgi:hypothetical protein